MAHAGETSLHTIIEMPLEGEMFDESIAMEPTRRRFRYPIFQVPSYIRTLDPDAYEPTKISFGPYHYKKGTPTDMEDFKGEYRDIFVLRNPSKRFEDYVEAVRMIKEEVKESYRYLKHMDDEEFINMMTLDGCVILEVLNKAIIDSRRIDDLILLDIMLVENQIPFIVLETIWDAHGTIRTDNSLIKSFQWLMRKIYSPNPDAEFPFDENIRPLHLLHLLGLTMFPNSAPDLASELPQRKSFPHLTYLLDRGVKLSVGHCPDLKISFKDGVITMNPLKITEYTVRYFTNLIAFELCYYKATIKTSSYAVLMNFLIRGAQDVVALHSKGILNWDEEKFNTRNHVDDLFQTLSTKTPWYKLDEDFDPQRILEWLLRPNQVLGPVIFRVPDHIRRLNPDAFKPRVISFGPYHHGREHLKDGEIQKRHYRDKLFERWSYRSNASWNGLLDVVRAIQDKARQYYKKPLGLGNEVDFAEMMALDSCAQIHFLTRLDWRSNEDDFKRDMMLIENQIPFVVLLKISLYLRCLPKLMKRLVQFAKDVYYLDEYEMEDYFSQAPFHLVDILRHKFFPWAGYNFDTIYSTRQSKSSIIPRLSQLKRQGVRIVSTKEPGLEVAFAFNQGELCINRLSVNHFMNIYLQNVIAFEQNYEWVDKTASSYVVLMNNLIGSREDVELLTERHIVSIRLTRSEDIVNMFKNLCEGIEKFYIDPCLTANINKYVNSRHRRWMSDLKENYLKTPWLIISVLGAFLLLALTTLQTGYTIASFYRGN